MILHVDETYGQIINWSDGKSGLTNAICLSIAETAKCNGVDFYEYLKKLLTDLPNLGIHQNPEILDQYMPWSKIIPGGV